MQKKKHCANTAIYGFIIAASVGGGFVFLRQIGGCVA
jgi:hypothetical protein